MIMFFFCNDTATTEIYTLSLHDALPILCERRPSLSCPTSPPGRASPSPVRAGDDMTSMTSTRRVVTVGVDTHSDVHHARSEEHTSELQSRQYLVCRLLLEKKNNSSMICI